MSVADYWKVVTRGEERGAAAAVVRGLLRLLSGPMWLGLQANLGIYRWGLRKQVRVDCPVLVVGNLSLGGTGKTTATAYLVRRLAASAVTAGIILRGYRRKSGLPPLLVSDGCKLLVSSLEAGDEAALLASLLPGHPVAVGVRREKVARLLLRETSVDALVLDDGFQYFRLARDADIALVDASHRIEEDRLFPGGSMREPHKHLRRATQVWITHAELVGPERVDELREWVEQVAPGLPIVVTEHRATGMRPLTDAAPPPEGARVIALSALGNPKSFESSVRRLGYDVQPLSFDDHHRYEPSDWDRVQEAAAAVGAGHVITTEKDAVKLPPPPGLPSVHVLGCELGIVAGGDAVDELVRAIR